MQYQVKLPVTRRRVRAASRRRALRGALLPSTSGSRVAGWWQLRIQAEYIIEGAGVSRIAAQVQAIQVSKAAQQQSQIRDEHPHGQLHQVTPSLLPSP